MGLKSSVKIFLIHDKKILLYLRDNKTSISDPNCWDTPGTDIQKGESPLDAINNDLVARFSVKLNNDPLLLGKIKNNIGVEHFIFYYKASAREVSELRLTGYGQKAGFFNLSEMGNIKLTLPIKSYFDSYGEYLFKIVEGRVGLKKVEITKLGLYS